jgi:hypothetical protein
VVMVVVTVTMVVVMMVIMTMVVICAQQDDIEPALVPTPPTTARHSKHRHAEGLQSTWEYESTVQCEVHEYCVY